MPIKTGRRLLAFVGALWLAVASVLAQDSLNAAKTLYEKASYQEALAMLDRLGRIKPASSETTRGIALYRVLALLALNRGPEANRVIAAGVREDPTFPAMTEDIAPRVQRAIKDARRRVLPVVARERYDAGKAALDKKDEKAAAALFREVLAIIDDPDLVGYQGDPSLADLRVLASAFLDQAAEAEAPAAVGAPRTPASPATPPGPVVKDAPPSTTPPTGQAAPARAPVPDTTGRYAPPVYSESDPRVTPPIIIRQNLPHWPWMSGLPEEWKTDGILEIVIDEKGDVVTAVMRRSMNVVYDQIVIEAARTWQYKPALLDGQPVRFRKTLDVTLAR